jgi:hypothetical protein
MTVATKAKGPWNMLRRVGTISRRYGLTPRNMDRVLSRFAGWLAELNCSATFPVTGAALARSPGIIEKYQARHVEFAVHGYYHVDHQQLPLDEQLAHFTRARHLFEARGLTCHGFRSPYLRWNEDTLSAIRQTGLLYDSSQVIAWNVADGSETEAYRRVLRFYNAISADAYPALPRQVSGLVRIPYCVPDDEALIDRLQFDTAATLNKPWLAILAETYRRGELFTLGLHPERITLCEAPLLETLRAAHALSPGVWMARLDTIARWWTDRTEAEVTIGDGDPAGRGASSGRAATVSVKGPEGVTILARNVEVTAPVEEWDGVYRRVHATDFSVPGVPRPFIGVSPRSAPDLTSFLRQQGYIVEPAGDDQAHTLYLDRPQFGYADERPLLDQIENGDGPLVRLGRWPHGARSALCVTGDIDALTLWDYGLRFLGN